MMAAPGTEKLFVARCVLGGVVSIRSGSSAAQKGDILRCLLVVLCWLCVSARNSLVDDLLLPYPLLSKHGPSHTHREVRDCQPVIHGNTTYEVWPSSNHTVLPLVSSKVFASVFANGIDKKTVLGHFTFINNPLKTVSVLEPGGVLGCSKNTTATVEETVKYGKCVVAQNGGFFNTTTGECLGNIVSNGRLVQNSGGIQNAQFGIKADGTMVFGYLSEEQVLDEENPFVQLVSGVVWLLRNGEVYIEQSKAAECDKSQNTGSFDYFVDVVSARTAVGHDQEGRLILFHVDGQTDSRGLTLWEMATFLKKQGVINAINLDGGGSATLVINGTLSNYPSDHCVADPMWRCPRSISTIICVHEPYCDPPDCGDHGQCVSGECRCSGAWTGPACDILNCGPSNCAHGNCTEGVCMCDAGWTGDDCSNVSYSYEPVTYTTQRDTSESGAKMILFTEQTWATLSCVLAVLLAVSAAFNIKRVSWCQQRNTDWKYSYQQLKGDADAVEICEPWNLNQQNSYVESLHSEAQS
ncbi:N-acetylglucosamine-1-phosphodiester alpha-N-acetylglucosaminidase [Spea bombifrons]|uniref:N-acetylglucosamine-1-phosphodiester alpha-N-acetylglucosaminidase n=1 Tax=Spea bombifrons TaxID=233779 RepID=UPI00234BC683|nr:N-acetylglucosamine-1-phosphodiester alpha-N-acetylglucosaminidase [Spea bombifrons]